MVYYKYLKSFGNGGGQASKCLKLQRGKDYGYINKANLPLLPYVLFLNQKTGRGVVLSTE